MNINQYIHNNKNMPPPTQAGRFKPRKPAKRIVPGAATAAAEVGSNDAANSFPPSSSSSNRHHQQQHRPGRGGGGRQSQQVHGHGGRGSNMPRGQVFFTGNAAPQVGRARSAGGSGGKSSTSDASTSGGKKTLTTKMEGKHEASDEVIVGELDEAIGSGGQGSDPTSSSKGPSQGGNGNASRTNTSFIDEETSTPNLLFSIPDTYDSDSSQEERNDRRRVLSSQFSMLQPSCLPFPDAPVPVGIGPVQVRPSLYTDSHLNDCAPGMEASSPFVDIRTNEALRLEEKKSWFLFQFPTRLPFDHAVVPPTTVSSSDEVAMPAANANEMEVSDVSIPTLLPNAFDNSMGTRAGKLGKISVFKSGKTILDMGGTKFIVSEGLPCGFAQQAVLIDVPNANYIPMGSVGKTVVVTPNIIDAFAE